MACMPIEISITKCPLAFLVFLYHFCQEMRKIKAIKCPPNSSPQGGINSNPNHNLKISRTQTLMESIKIEHASDYGHFWT